MRAELDLDAEIAERRQVTLDIQHLFDQIFKDKLKLHYQIFFKSITKCVKEQLR